jgi:hypothetical protein
LHTLRADSVGLREEAIGAAEEAVQARLDDAEDRIRALVAGFQADLVKPLEPLN